jgi:hypothetical protein
MHTNTKVTVTQRVECLWKVMAHAQKADFVFRLNGRVHLNRRGRQFSRLLAAEVCASAVVMLDTPCSEVVWRVLAILSIRQFPLRFHYHASPCAITFQLDSWHYIRENVRFPKFQLWLSCSCIVKHQSCVFWLPPRGSWQLRSSGSLRSVITWKNAVVK